MIPIIHARIHQKIKQHSLGNVVEYKLVKEWVARIIIKKGGVPREDINATIQDLIDLGLLENLSKKKFTKFKILPNKERKVRDPIF